MRTFLLKIALLASLLTALAACNKSKQDDQPLPPALREEFNCYINGEYWERVRGGNCSSIDFKYYQNAAPGGGPAGYLVIRGKNCTDRTTMSIVVDSVFETIDLGQVKEVRGAMYYNPRDYEYPHSVFDSLLNIQLSIDKLEAQTYRDAVFPDGTPYVDVTNGWIEGTFEMTLINDLQDTVRITDGNFAAILY